MCRASRWRPGSRCPSVISTLGCPSKWCPPVCAISSCRFAMERWPAPASRIASSTWRWPRSARNMPICSTPKPVRGGTGTTTVSSRTRPPGSAAGCVAGYLHRHGLASRRPRHRASSGTLHQPAVPNQHLGAQRRRRRSGPSGRRRLFWWDRGGWTFFPGSRLGAAVTEPGRRPPMRFPARGRAPSLPCSSARRCTPAS